MKNNIIITSAGKRVSLTLFFKETLQRFFPHAKVFTIDMNPDFAPAAYMSDQCFQVPRVTDDCYIPTLLSLCKENEIGMVIPTIDTELLILSENRELFAKNGIYVIISDSSFIKICRDKRQTSVFFESCGIRVPKFIDKNAPSFPLFAKPYDGSLSTNLHFIRNRDELTPEIINDDKLIFMEYIDKTLFKEYTVDMYYDREGSLKCIVPRERIEIRAGEINKGRTEKNELVDFIRKRMGHIDGCVGCICVQFFYRAESQEIIGIEINPRFGGGYPLSYMSGANYPEFLIREFFLDEKIEYYDGWRNGVLMLRFDDAVYV